MATMVRRLAQKEHSVALSQLASHISVVVKFGVGAGEDPFYKVKELITDLMTYLIIKLHSEAFARACHKSCWRGT